MINRDPPERRPKDLDLPPKDEIVPPRDLIDRDPKPIKELPPKTIDADQGIDEKNPGEPLKTI